MRRTLAAAVLLVILLSAAFVSLLYVSEGGLTSKHNAYRYSNASEVRPSASEIGLLLATLGQTVNFSDINVLHGKLAPVIRINSGKDPVGEYTRALFYLSGNLTEIQTQLTAARSNLTLGDRKNASAAVVELEQRREQSSILLHALPSLLKRVGEQYQIDTTSQLTRLNTLTQIFNDTSAQINQLASELNTQAVLIKTVLSLNSSSGVVLVGRSVHIFGTLETANGTFLENRTITILWGSNQVELQSNSRGYFDTNVSFPAGANPGLASIEATYMPSGPDELTYLGSMAEVRVQLFYEPTVLTANVAPINAKPLDVVNVWGNLKTTLDKKPLENRTVALQLDGTFLENATTDSSGIYFSTFNVPRAISNGTHTVEVIYNATGDIFAPSNATVSFNIKILLSRTQVVLDRTSVLSGTSLTINVTVTYVNDTQTPETGPPSGNVTIYLDNATVANATLNRQGSLIYKVQVALGTSFGPHSILIEYYPDQPWAESSRNTAAFNVINIPIIAVAVSIVAIVSVVGTYAFRRNTRRATLSVRTVTTQAVLHEEAGFQEEFSHSNLTSALDAQTGGASKIKMAYGLAQVMVSKRLGIQTRASETPNEFLLRIGEIAPALKVSLASLVELFELSEYSAYPIEADNVREARESLLRLREELENVRAREDLNR
jgi:hypothetical protein